MSFAKKQKLIVETSPINFRDEVNAKLKEGWIVVPHTHESCWENVASGHSAGRKSENGYFAIVVEKE
jgi:hypothetical protein